MSDFPVPESIKKFVLDNSKMESLSMVSSLCGETYLKDLYYPCDQEVQDDNDLMSDCSISSDPNLQSLQSSPYAYPIHHDSQDDVLHQSPCTQDINNNQQGFHYSDWPPCYNPAYNMQPHITPSHGHRVDNCSPVNTNFYDYSQFRVDNKRDMIQEQYDSDESVEFTPADIVATTASYTNAHNSIKTSIYNDNSRKSQLPAFSEFFGKPRSNTKGSRGRPVTYKRPGSNFIDIDDNFNDDDERLSKYSCSSKVRRGAKNILLWKFLLEELGSKKATHVQWVNQFEGTFKFVDTAECSKLWGLKKKKEDMNFEKLSRGIRHYYRDGLMSRLDGTRLVYKFNWDRVPKAFRKLC